MEEMQFSEYQYSPEGMPTTFEICGEISQVSLHINVIIVDD